MAEFDGPFIVESDPFYDAYLETLEALASIGVLLEFRARIPIFKIYTDLQRQEQTEEVIQALYHLDVLKELMVRGLEPEHKNNVYT